MENFVSFGFSDMSKTVKKKRSNPSRRFRDDSESCPDYKNNSSLSFTPLTGNGRKASHDKNAGHNTNFQRKYLNLNQCSSGASYVNLAGAEAPLKVSNEDRGFGESNEYGIKNIGECEETGMDVKSYAKDFAPSNWSKANDGLELLFRAEDTHINEMVSGSHSSGKSGVASDGQVNEYKLRKVKLKLGRVIRTIHANSASDGTSIGESSSIKSSRSSDTPSPLQKLDVQPVRKSSRTHKRRLLDGKYSFGDDDTDEEIRYLEKLNTGKVARCNSAECEDQSEDGSKKHCKISRVLYQIDARDFGLSRSVKKSKNSRSGSVSADNDFMEDEEPLSDGEPESRRKKQKKEFVDMLGDSKKEMVVTTRQQARRTGKDISGFGGSIVEFPNGLPPSPPRKQKEKLSELEQQLKKAEVAQRRKVQMDKAARESEAEAIRKILGQDSSRKKREGKIKRRREELAQERTANATSLPSNTVRWVMCPTGTVVTFPDDMGLPSILQHKHCSYPPPREKCAGPFCTNPCKYRDSKLKLPLCSLQCYKAVHEKMKPMAAC